MLYGLSLPPFGAFADPRRLAELAETAEQSGWEGFFLWDHMLFDTPSPPIADPWVALAAIAMRTSRMRIGPLVTPLPRRRPWKLAREAVSLDHLSAGRLILGVGIGAPAHAEFEMFAEPTDATVRAQQLDEGLAILAGLWRGEPFHFQGEQYQLQEMTFLPRPLQTPRIPIWVAGIWPNKRPMRRAAQWDGVFPIGQTSDALTVGDWRAIHTYVAQYRSSDAAFDFICSGSTNGSDNIRDRAHVARYADAGCTWWIEDISPWRFGYRAGEVWSLAATAAIQERVMQGPPR